MQVSELVDHLRGCPPDGHVSVAQVKNRTVLIVKTNSATNGKGVVTILLPEAKKA